MPLRNTTRRYELDPTGLPCNASSTHSLQTPVFHRASRDILRRLERIVRSIVKLNIRGRKRAMRRFLLMVIIGALGVCVAPDRAFAQSAIAGVVKDATGAVLPGVTVEATSPALIEKSKSTTTNEAGQYRLVDLRPGTYAVTFALSGFSTVRRNDIVLETNFTAPINVEMKLGQVAESVTVTGASPVVDVQTSQRREVVNQELLESLPTGRNFQLMAGTVPSVTTGVFDVGGSSAMWTGGSLLVHGSLTN